VAGFIISPTQTQVGVVRFSEVADSEFYLDKFKDAKSLADYIAKMDIHGGETNIASAIRLTRTDMFTANRGARPQVPRIAVLLTDGVANREKNSTIPESVLARNFGIEIFTVGITNQANADQLKLICSSPVATHYYYVSDYSRLGDILKSLVTNLCTEPNSVPIVS